MLTFSLVEDDERTRREMSRYIERFSKEIGVQIAVNPYPDAIQFLTRYRRNSDLILMDISLPGMDGMEAARQLREVDQSVLLIFVTSLARYAVSGYSVDALDFIIKPIVYEELSLKLRRALVKLRQRQEKIMPIISGENVCYVPIHDILYVEIQKHLLLYHCFDKVIRSYGTLKSVSQRAEFADFIFCNSCYLVNPSKVTGVEGYTLMIGDKRLQISHPKKHDFMLALSRYLGGSENR